MMRKKGLYLVVSLFSLGLILSSCNMQGPKGETGDAGTNGTNGTDGKDGTNGKDGSSFLTGNGVPSNNDGNNDDVYLDIDTYDLYKKSDDKWNKIGNIKGQNGTSGSDGSDGTSGNDGVTYYSNTILPCDGGYITCDKGSAQIGESVRFIFALTDYDNKDLVSFKLNDKNYFLGDATKVSNGVYSFSTTMVKNGFVVSAEFGKKTKVTTKAELTTAINNDEVKVVNVSQNIDLSTTPVTISGDKVFTYDGNGEKPKITATNNAFDIGDLDNDAHVIFNNLDITSTNGRGIAGADVTSGNVEVNNCNIVAYERGINFGADASTELNLTVKNTTIDVTSGGTGQENRGISFIKFDKGSVNIENVTSKSNSFPLYLWKDQGANVGDINIEIKNSSFERYGSKLSDLVNSNITIDGSTFKGVNTFTGYQDFYCALCYEADESAHNNTGTFNNCTFIAIDNTHADPDHACAEYCVGLAGDDSNFYFNNCTFDYSNAYYNIHDETNNPICPWNPSISNSFYYLNGVRHNLPI